MWIVESASRTSKTAGIIVGFLKKRQAEMISKILTLLKKIRENPGRLLFLRGAFEVDPTLESVPDSFRAEYAEQAVRCSELFFREKIQATGTSWRLFPLFKRCLHRLRFWIQFPIQKELGKALAHEARLLSGDEGARSG